MKNLLPAFLLLFSIFSCNEKVEKPRTLCADPCLKDSLKFKGEHVLSPYVYIVPANCFADTIIWSHKLLPRNKKIIMSEYTKRDVNLSQNTIQAFFRDTGYVWLVFNDCNTSRGYVMRLPYDTTSSLETYSSALNRIDPKYNIAEGLIAYADYTFVYVQDMNTGKKEQIKLDDKELDINFNEIHNTFDSVHVTRNRIYVKLKGKEALEKNISL